MALKLTVSHVSQCKVHNKNCVMSVTQILMPSSNPTNKLTETITSLKTLIHLSSSYCYSIDVPAINSQEQQCQVNLLNLGFIFFVMSVTDAKTKIFSDVANEIN